ncbi:hypothetical protein KHA80_05390 [Anaerobacillus sp. HL2]|nr:hypothetical protein KHA80_05390 [Anaerobacillus sp. HL2]
MDELVRSGELYCSIDNILKDFKKNQIHREGLHIYYNHAVDTFQGLIRDISIDLLITVTIPDLDDNDVQRISIKYYAYATTRCI